MIMKANYVYVIWLSAGALLTSAEKCIYLIHYLSHLTTCILHGYMLSSWNWTVFSLPNYILIIIISNTEVEGFYGNKFLLRLETDSTYNLTPRLFRYINWSFFQGDYSRPYFIAGISGWGRVMQVVIALALRAGQKDPDKSGGVQVTVYADETCDRP